MYAQNALSTHLYGRRASRLPLILLTMGLFLIAGLIFSAENLPDYESYEQIYDIGGINFLLVSKELLFVAFIQFIKYLGLDYEQFRAVILLVSIGILSLSLFQVDRWLRAVNYKSDIAILKMHPLMMIFTSAALLVFLLEFFQVRIRGGLSLSLIALSFSFYLTASRPNALRNIAVTFALFFLAYGIHASTALMLGYLLFAPILYGVFFSRLRRLQPAILSFVLRYVVYCIIVSASFFLVIMVSIQSEERGENVFSPLNGFRLFCISVVPLLLVIFSRFSKPNTGVVKATLNSSNALSFHDYRAVAISRRRLSWITLSTGCYLSLAFALLVLDGAGFITESGEAMVRIFTLSSVPAIFVILLGSNRFSNIWFFLLFSNSLFFVYTLTTPLRAG